MQKRFDSRTIRGLIVTFVSLIVGQLARLVDAPITEAETADLLEQIATLAQQAAPLIGQLVETVGAMWGLYMSYRGRMNPKITPIGGES